MSTDDEIRIGVFVCRCGINIAGVLDTPKLADYSAKLPNVAHATDNISLCTTSGADLIREAVDEHKLNRIVIAAWTPKTHQPVFQAVLKDAGLDPSYLEFVNIREHVSFVHMNEKEKAQLKAEELIRAGVARTVFHEIIPEKTFPVEKKALVIGGGVAGMQAALDLASEYEVYLVEKVATIGGKMAMLDRTFPTDDCSIWILGPLMLEVNRNEKIHLMTLAEVQKVSGFVGNFEVEVLQHAKYTNQDCNGCGACVDVCPAYGASEFDQNLGTRKAIYIAFAQAVPMIAQIDMDKCIKCGLCAEACELNAVNFDDTDKIEKLKVGTIIVATGWSEFREEGYLGYGKYPNVITQLELERILAPNGPTFGDIVRPSDGKHPHKILFVQCVGSRDLKRNRHCSSGVCCLISIKNTKLIKQHSPDTDITVAFIDIRAGGKAYEEYYLESRKYGVKYVKASIPRIQEDPETHNLKVYMQDMLENCSELEEQEFDMVVLSSAMEPATGIATLNEKLKLERSPDGFFKEFHSRLSPIDTSTVGVTLAGAAQGPKSIAETIMQAKGAASSANITMRPGEYTMRMEKAIVDEIRCSKCGMCVENCPYGAITLDPKERFAVVDEIKCRSCGICANTCPSQAITVRNSRHSQFSAVIDNLLYRAMD